MANTVIRHGQKISGIFDSAFFTFSLDDPRDVSFTLFYDICDFLQDGYLDIDVEALKIRRQEITASNDLTEEDTKDLQEILLDHQPA